jgi:hypothetical protein
MKLIINSYIRIQTFHHIWKNMKIFKNNGRSLKYDDDNSRIYSKSSR